MSLFERPSESFTAVTILPGDLSPEDRAVLARAVDQLEHSSFATKLANALGHEIERLGRMLPQPVATVADRAVEGAIRTAFSTALRTLRPRAGGGQRAAHKAVATLSGTLGGAFGFAALPVELPFSTVVMLRSIAAIARASGEDLSQPEAALPSIMLKSKTTKK